MGKRTSSLKGEHKKLIAETQGLKKVLLFECHFTVFKAVEIHSLASKRWTKGCQMQKLCSF